LSPFFEILARHHKATSGASEMIFMLVLLGPQLAAAKNRGPKMRVADAPLHLRVDPSPRRLAVEADYRTVLPRAP